MGIINIAGDLAVSYRNDSVGHWGDGGVVRHYDHRHAALPAGALQKREDLLAGIVVNTGLYSVNIAVMGGSSLLNMNKTVTVFYNDERTPLGHAACQLL